MGNENSTAKSDSVATEFTNGWKEYAELGLTSGATRVVIRSRNEKAQRWGCAPDNTTQVFSDEQAAAMWPLVEAGKFKELIGTKLGSDLVIADASGPLRWREIDDETPPNGVWEEDATLNKPPVQEPVLFTMSDGSFGGVIIGKQTFMVTTASTERAALSSLVVVYKAIKAAGQV